MALKSSKLRCEATLRQLWEKSSYFRPSPDRSKPLNLRLRRSLSWVARAEHETDDCDAAFVFYWIAFNAAYGQRGSPWINQETETELFRGYLRKVVACDSDAVNKAVWPRLVDRIRLLMDNEYVFEPFWRHHNNEVGFQDWRRKHESSWKKAKWALGRAVSAPASEHTECILRELFDRLYTLRNQLLHGGATWRGRVNREQVRTGTALMAALIPCFIEVMIRHPEADWGIPRYPPVA